MARYTYAYERKPYYARHRSYVMPDGSILETLTTRYTFGKQAMRNTTGPRGGKAYKPYYHCVYYANGCFYRAANLEIAPGEWINTLEPISGLLYEIPTSNRDSKANANIPVASIHCENGTPRSIVIDGDEMPLTSNAWPMCEELLGLDHKPRKSAKAA